MGSKCKFKLLFLIITLIVIATTAIGCASQNVNRSPKAIEGMLDLRNVNLTQDGVFALDGQWEFYWNQLLAPQELTGLTPKEPSYIDFPKAWNGHAIEGEALSGEGHATYRLTMKTEELNGLVGLKIPRILTSYKMWVNGDIVASAGSVSDSSTEMIPQYLPQAVFFDQEDENEIVIQVSNYRHRSGGILESLTFGEKSQIMDMRNKSIALELFLFGSILIMGCYHIALFVFRKKELSPLYFGLFCLFVAVRTLLVGEIYFINIFPDFSWETAHKMQTLSFYLGVPLLFMFFKVVFPDYISQRVMRIAQGIGLVFGALVLFTPARVFTKFNTVFQILTLFLIGYFIYVLVRIIKNKEIGAKFIGVGAFILIVTTLNDMVYLSTWMGDRGPELLKLFFRSGNLSSFGQLGFIFTHSLVLGQKFSNALTNEERMAVHQKKLNENLEDLVKMRTKELVESYDKIQTQKLELQEANKALQLLSTKDPLTDIWNRRHFDKTLELEWRRCARLTERISLIFIDLDYFKLFNDCYGHQAGDLCLQKIAYTIKNTFNRAGDIVARYGGEEFVVLIPYGNKKKTMETAEKLRKTILELRIPHDKSPICDYVTASFGVSSMVPSGNNSHEQLVQSADQALYLAKAEGRNQVKYYENPTGIWKNNLV